MSWPAGTGPGLYKQIVVTYGATLPHPPRRILVPHGTFTMAETGMFLEAALARGELGEQVTVVLVGSLQPLGEPGSDAEANLAVAVERLREEEPGVAEWRLREEEPGVAEGRLREEPRVALVMGGRTWAPGRVVKDPETGQFREIAGTV